MPSPFPGMDPYLEASWGDVHTRLMTYACDQLQERLPGDLRARMEERVFVDSTADRPRPIYPDVRVVERPGREGKPPRESGGVGVAEPLVVRVPKDEPMTQVFVEIRDARSGHRVVTVIELLSPTNKWPGEGQDAYLRKQRELRQGGVNSVEIDLTRSGRRILALPPDQIPLTHRTTYQVCVRRGGRPDEVEVYRVPLRERLPVIPIPLREHDEDALLDLQALVDRAYRNGGYDGDIDYRAEPDPPLDRDDAAWVDTLLRERGFR